MPHNDDHKMEKHSVIIAGHATSITLENIFWRAFKTLAKKNKKSISALVTEIDQTRDANLSSSIRVFILQEYMKEA